MVQLGFKLNDGTIDYITFSKDFLDIIDDSDFFYLAEKIFQEKYNDDSLTVLSCGGVDCFIGDDL